MTLRCDVAGPGYAVPAVVVDYLTDLASLLALSFLTVEWCDTVVAQSRLSREQFLGLASRLASCAKELMRKRDPKLLARVRNDLLTIIQLTRDAAEAGDWDSVLDIAEAIELVFDVYELLGPELELCAKLLSRSMRALAEEWQSPRLKTR